MKILIKGSDILAMEVVEEKTTVTDGKTVYPKHIIPGWQIVDAETPAGFMPEKYMWDNGLTLKPDTADAIGQVKTEKLTALAAFRYDRECAGIVVGGAKIKTDMGSQAKLAGAKFYFDLVPNTLIDWKAQNGWVQIDRPTLLKIGQAVGAHIQACYSRERAHAEAINALSTIAKIEAYDITTGWPV